MLELLVGSKIKELTYFGVELWVPEDFYDRPVSYGSVIFHLESVKRGYQLHAIAGSKDSMSANLSFDTFYANFTTSLLKILGSDMQVCYVWIVFKKTNQYVLLYVTGPTHTINDKYEEYMEIAYTINPIS